MKNVIEKLCASKLDWQELPDNPYVFQAEFQNQMVRLRLNDFPDEPLCTVIVNNQEMNLDEFPNTWTLPLHRRMRERS